ncbi:MAG: Fe-S cluster assembly protein SufD [Gaiellales bacterium]
MDRAEALDRYRSLPLPDTSMEAWRFTDLRGFDPDSFGRNGHVEVTQGTVTATVPRPEEAAMLDVDMAGLATAADGKIEIENAPAGVEFAPLPEDHERLGTLVGTDDKFSAHNAASWRSGLLVRVPKGMELDDPLYVRVTVDDDAASFWRLLVVAEEGSRFSLIEEYTSPSAEAAGYSNAAVELFVEQGAKLEYVSLQNLAKETWHFATHRATVGKDAELDWVAGGFGSRRGKVRIHNDLAGQGATSRVTGAYFADGTQHLDYDTFQQHHAPSTTSDFAFKGVLREQASVVWRGMIRVEEDAQKTNAYQENRNLILSPDAHADSIPGLEILANDVRCTHGATISQVDREQLFYAMSRGLTRGDAERLIVRGFFQDVLDRIELAPVRDALAERLEARIPHS